MPRRRVNGMNHSVSVLRTVVSPCTRSAFSALGLDGRAWRDALLRLVLRDAHAGAIAVVGPAVVAADDVAGLAESLRELGGAVAAAVLQRRGLALRIEPQHDVLAEQRERL